MKKIWKKRLAAAAVLTTVFSLSSTFPVATQTAEAKADLNNIFDFEAHRGGRDARPENTLYSYTYAIEHGATCIECDMQLTKDGQIVMSHNPVLNHDITRSKDGTYVPKGKYDIRKMTVSELKQFDVGIMDKKTKYYKSHGSSQIEHTAKIPTLEELLQLIQQSGDKDVYLNIETKSYPDPVLGNIYKNSPNPQKFVETFNKIIKKYGMENRVILQSFDWNTLRLMKKLNPNVSLSALWQQQPSWGAGADRLRPLTPGKSPWLGGLDIDDFKGDPVAAAHAIGVDVVSPYYKEITQDQVNEAHSFGMKVVPWTVNSVKSMSMLYDMGVDGIISDKPWLLRSFLEKRGAKLRPVHPFASKYHLDKDHQETPANIKAEKALNAAY